MMTTAVLRRINVRPEGDTPYVVTLTVSTAIMMKKKAVRYDSTEC